jgi:LCP family protein required for cell wall assembly
MNPSSSRRRSVDSVKSGVPVSPVPAANPTPPKPAQTPSADDTLDIQELVARPFAEPTALGAQATREPVFQYRVKNTKKRWRFNRPSKRVMIAGGLVLGAIGLFLIGKFILATSRIITRNSGGGAPALAGKLDPNKLKGEGDGRVNILVLGIGGDNHAGGNLSDTMLVVSIDPRTKDVAMLGLPRDMYVPIPGYGSTKINAAHAYGEQDEEGGGPVLAKQVVEKILDIPIHYYARIDFNGFKKAIDAVGGVDVVVEDALYDPAYPCDGNAGYCPFSIRAGNQHLDGATALKFVRCRHGSCGNDFGRAARQQQVLVALREKSISAPTLLNPSKISSLIDAVGDHVKTDLSLSDISKLIDIGKGVDPTKIVQKVLDTSPEGLLVSGNIAGSGYVEIPRAGVGNFSEIQQLVHSIFVDNYIKEENAAVEVQNGTTRNGLATTVGNLLKSYQYNVVKTVTADNQNYSTTILYDYTGGKKPFTIRYLENRFGIKAQKASAPKAATGETAPDIRIIIGSDYRVTK